ncbi:MAG: carbohydrate-binding domain-containing protein, partial [Clostridia bacterium]|nr:carbohydrate-binding domain-containing protein [Clostridia bacterium]
MKKLTKKNLTAMIISLALIMSFVGCSTTNNTTSDDNTTATINSNQNDTDKNDTTSSDSSSKVKTTSSTSADDMFTSRDKEVGYDDTTSVTITLADNKTSSSDNSVTVDGNTVTITKEGTYILSGTLTNGQIIVNTDSSQKVQLVLNGVNINCETSSAIYVKQADKVFITLANGSENTLSNSKEFVNTDDEEIDAVIYSKDDITFNGSGKLTVNAKYGHGIVSKDDLVFTSGTYTVTAQNHALSGKDSVRIADGTFNLTAGKDGIHSENTKDTDKGFIYIENGTFKITSDGDGMDASLSCQIVSGTIDITSGGGVSNATQKQDNDMMFGRNFNQNNTNTSSDEDSSSAKGIKSDGDITISGGTVNINSSDDALHSNTNLNITKGTLTISTGDDAIH